MSLYPALSGRRVPARMDGFLEHVGVVDVEAPIPDSMGVGTEARKYLRYVSVDPEVEEIYNIKVDPMGRPQRVPVRG